MTQRNSSLARLYELPVNGGRTTAYSRNRIFVRGLRLEARIGILDWERQAPQPLIVDIECALPSEAACESDSLDDTVDYAAVVERIRALALDRHFQLVEAMAQQMAETIQFEFGVPWLRLTLTKTAPIPGVEVGITIERGAHDPAQTELRF